MADLIGNKRGEKSMIERGLRGHRHSLFAFEQQIMSPGEIPIANRNEDVEARDDIVDANPGVTLAGRPSSVGFLQCHIQNAGDMDRFAVAAVVDLVAAAGTVGHDDIVGLSLANGGQQREFGHRQ